MNQKKSSIFLLIGAVVVTSLIVIGVLYIAGFLQPLSSSESLMHQEGMDHTQEGMVHIQEGMTHTDGMNHETSDGQNVTTRQAEVAQRGAEVMPFDLERTTHLFEKTAYGGLQQVLSDDGDREQIALIQAHLQEESIQFQQGGFEDPAQIHGHEMPGLALLRTDYSQVEVVYTQLADGAQIDYKAETPELIDAIHIWFDAQLSDHGAHAADGRSSIGE